jgi:hypothetical protein
MNDNTVLRIKVPAHLYESVKKQLTLKENKKPLKEEISGTEEELKDFYLKVKQIEAEGTDLDSAIQHAMFDINNPDDAKELSSMSSIYEAKGNTKAPKGWTVVKEKKAPVDGMKQVEEDKNNLSAAPVSAPKSGGSELDKKIEKAVNSGAVLSAIKILNSTITDRKSYVAVIKALMAKLKTGEGTGFSNSVDSNPSTQRVQQNLDSLGGISKQKA